MADWENLQRVQRNVERMREQNAPEGDVVRYLQGEGFSEERFQSSLQAMQDSGGREASYGPAHAFARGATFGWNDVIDSRVASLMGQGDYDELLAARRQAGDNWRQEHPVGSMATEMAGTLPWMAVPGAAAGRAVGQAPRAGGEGARSLLQNLGATRSGRYGSAAAGGAGGGALYGAGVAAPGERAEGAAEGAAIGAGAGLAGQGAMDMAAPLMARMPWGSNARATQQRADEFLRTAMDRDGTPPDALRQRVLQSAQRADKPETLMDFGGENLLGMADAVVRYPGDGPRMARSLQEVRQGDQANRIIRDLENTFGVQGDRAEILGTVQAVQREKARPLYEQAFSNGQNITDPEVLNMLALPRFDQAYQAGRRLARYEGNESLPERLFDADGNLTVDSLPLETLNYVKMGLDEVLFTGRQPGSGLGAAELRALRDARQRFVDGLDRSVPEYAQARAAWGGPAQMLDAIEDGAKSWRLRPDEIGAAMQGLSPDSQQAYRFGALDDLRRRLVDAPDGRDRYKMVFGSEGQRDRIRALIGDENFGALQSQMRREAVMRRSDDKLRGGSDTTSRQIASRELDSAGILNQIANDGLIRTVAGRMAPGPGGNTASAMAPSLFSMDPAAQLGTLNRMEDLPRVQSTQNLMQSLNIAPGAIGNQLLED